MATVTVITARDRKIIKDIENHIHRLGHTPGTWYVGVSDNAGRTLRKKHRASGENYYICRQTSSSEVAADIQRYFITRLRTDGTACGGTADSDMIYAYKKSNKTTP